MNPPTTQPHPAAGPVADQHPLTLLVLTSFFAESRHALGFAAALAAPLGARVVLLHVGQLTSPNDDIRLPPPPQASRELHEALRALASEQHVPTDFELVPDLLPGAAEDLARRYGPALFVLGRPAADRFDFDLGAAVLQILRHAQLPVLLVPETYTGPVSPGHLAVAADDEPFELHRRGKAAQQLLHKLAPARITVITASPMQDDERCAAALHHVRASGLLPLTAGSAPLVVAGFYATHPDKGVLAGLATLGADWLLVLARRHALLDGLFHRSVTSRLLLHSPVPVLVVPATEVEW